MLSACVVVRVCWGVCPQPSSLPKGDSRLTRLLRVKSLPGVNPNPLFGPILNSTESHEQALVSLKLKKPIDVGVGRTFAVIIEGGQMAK